MDSISLKEGETYIKLGQALKKAGIAGSGAEAAEIIKSGAVLVNGEEELRRGRKIKAGDEVTAAGKSFGITA